jgi:hypothetical protein
MTLSMRYKSVSSSTPISLAAHRGRRPYVYLSMFLAVVTMLFVIIPMVLAPVMMFVAMVAVLITVIGVISVALTIVGDIRIVVPVVPNKVDRLAAGVVLATMPTPIPFMSGPHMKINRGWQRFSGAAYPNDWRAVDKPRRRSITDIDSAKKSGFTDAYRYSDIGAKYRCAERHRSNSHRE